jgi:hypothetical protein
LLPKFVAQATGTYRIRISAYTLRSETAIPYSVHIGNKKMHTAGYFEAPADTEKPKAIEFVDRLEAGDRLHVVAFDMGGPRFQGKNQLGYDHLANAGLAVQWVEIEGPINESWPPESRRRILGDINPTAANLADAERVLRDFVPRAFRRPVPPSELAPYRDLIRASLTRGDRFEQALRMGLLGVLCSSNFLFLNEKPGKLDDFALASRLSYFLWSSMPDEKMIELARQGRLQESRVLRDLVERMLADPKSRRFTENFVGQWLDLRQIMATNPDKMLYPEFDELLQISMVKETELFFEEILKNDSNVSMFIDADFTMANERLARHYGIPGVEGLAMRKVKLPAGAHRGGVLTHASVLKVTANGTTTSPVTRGVWVLQKMLGRTVPPPPKDVPAIEPDVRGTTTIRAQLAKHRQDALCSSCHAKFDPLGFALENFDVIGGWREQYRIPGKGGVPYLMGPPVDSGDFLDGKRFSNVDDFKRILLANQIEVARGLTEKLMTYATGSPVRLVDRAIVDDILAQAAKNRYGLRSLVHSVVQSRAFREK